MKKLLLLSYLVFAACAQKPTPTPAPEAGTAAPELATASAAKPQATSPVELVFDSTYSGSKAVAYRKNEKLRMSGSAAFTPGALREIAKPAKKQRLPLYIVDLRQESHGLVNDKPVTWTADRDWANADLNHDEVIERERRLLGDLRVGEKVQGSEVKSIETENSLVATGGHNYIRLTVLEHVRPTDNEVDRFIQAIRAMPEEYWIHFHDRSGYGRTTLFMTMFDMLENAYSQPFEEIAKRNASLSNDSDFLSIASSESWKTPYLKEQSEFIQEFYQYAKAHRGGKDVLWTEWVKNEKK